jgi:hypothetical protein
VGRRANWRRNASDAGSGTGAPFQLVSSTRSTRIRPPSPPVCGHYRWGAEPSFRSELRGGKTPARRASAEQHLAAGRATVSGCGPDLDVVAEVADPTGQARQQLGLVPLGGMGQAGSLARADCRFRVRGEDDGAVEVRHLLSRCSQFVFRLTRAPGCSICVKHPAAPKRETERMRRFGPIRRLSPGPPSVPLLETENTAAVDPRKPLGIQRKQRPRLDQETGSAFTNGASEFEAVSPASPNDTIRERLSVPRLTAGERETLTATARSGPSAVGIARGLAPRWPWPATSSRQRAPSGSRTTANSAGRCRLETARSRRTLSAWDRRARRRSTTRSRRPSWCPSSCPRT